MNGKSNQAEYNCDEVRDLLDLLAAGDLPPEEAESYHRHLASCPECQAAYERVAEATGSVQDALAEAVPAHSELMDLWPAVRDQISHPARRRSLLGWLNLEPVRTLAIAGVLTVGLYLIIGVQDTKYPGGLPSFPVYESNPVIVSTATVDQRPARVSGIESSDGKTVFLWLE
ncbi:anti-sigma factor family protein [Candidatus Zixiibacteriota bacterium]